MASSIRRADLLSAQGLCGQRIILSNASLHERGITVALYHNWPRERVHPSDQRVRVVKIGARPARAERRTGGRSIEFIKRPGSLTIVPPGVAPDVRLCTISKLIICDLDRGLMANITEELDYQPSSPLNLKSGINDRAIAGILSLIADDLQAGSPLGNLYAETLSHALAIKLLHLDCSLRRIDSSSNGPLPPNKLKRIKELINSELESDLSLANLARESGYSRAHFLRMFRVATGITPHRYVLEKRLARAQQLLKETKTSLNSIAISCGFGSQNHMADVFRKNLDITPSEYRRQK